MTDIEMKSFVSGNDIQLKATYYVTGTTTPITPDAIPQIDIQLDGVSESGYPQNMVLVASNIYEHWWNSSAVAKDVYLVRFLALFDTHDTVGELKVQLK